MCFIEAQYTNVMAAKWEIYMKNTSIVILS